MRCDPEVSYRGRTHCDRGDSANIAHGLISYRVGLAVSLDEEVLRDILEVAAIPGPGAAGRNFGN